MAPSQRRSRLPPPSTTPSSPKHPTHRRRHSQLSISIEHICTILTTLLLGFVLGALSTLHISCSTYNSSSFSSSTTKPTYVFIYSTGRCGTQHFSRALKSLDTPASIITHEREHATLRARHIVHTDYVRIANERTEAGFNTSMSEYVRNIKVPFYNAQLKKNNASVYVHTGHVPGMFGLIPALIELIHRRNSGRVKVLRLRRDRIQTALSLMALGPPEEDPWSSSSAAGNKRWFSAPSHAHVRLRVSGDMWGSMNRLQRYLWVVDDLECRWQCLIRSSRLSERFQWAETSVERLGVMDGGEEWSRVARFMGVAVEWETVKERHNSIQFKNRSKLDVDEGAVRKWDEEYRAMVGKCRVSDDFQIGWGSSE